jgi:hypothetical protein
MFRYLVKEWNVENKCDSCFIVWCGIGKFDFLLCFVEALLLVWNSVVVSQIWSWKIIGGGEVWGFWVTLQLGLVFMLFLFFFWNAIFSFSFYGLKDFFLCYLCSCCEIQMSWPISYGWNHTNFDNYHITKGCFWGRWS